jgi:hypothetical protein
MGPAAGLDHGVFIPFMLMYVHTYIHTHNTPGHIFHRLGNLIDSSLFELTASLISQLHTNRFPEGKEKRFPIPIVQVSIHGSLDPARNIQLGQAIAALRYDQKKK